MMWLFPNSCQPGVNTLPQVIFGYADVASIPSIYAAATLLIAAVTIVIVSYSVWVARQTRTRARDRSGSTSRTGRISYFRLIELKNRRERWSLPVDVLRRG